ncbi:COBRA-like protein 7 [Dorcoceras hygrometricum]|uniref:COBRA-like protein 7 n=1 Tax=Dorcoceras hygrometricum TaxID=472368 RepID=A0A2Z7BJA0_9LAMI|nr:COBRA-like protein 7 [Dorcoceras hygrometricum]
MYYSSCNSSVFEHREIDQMQKAVSAVGKENRHCEFVYGISELNILNLPFFCNEKDPLEEFDYNDTRCNPLLRPTASRTPSNTTAHQPASCVCLTHFFTASVRKATRTCLTFMSKYYNEFFYV